MAGRDRFDGSITWVGHGTVLIEAAGTRVLVDGFVDSCPTAPESLKGDGLGHLDAILVTHGHGDHVADVVAHQQRTGAQVAGMVELMDWFAGQGISRDRLVDFNKGGTVELADGISVTMVDAKHSSAAPDGTYVGEPAGFVIELPDGFRIYHAGDTTVFGDMALIAELHEPDFAILPIGDHYTMGPQGAAKALALLGCHHVLGVHWGTFPPLVGRPQRLRELVAMVGVHVYDLEPGGVLHGTDLVVGA